MSVYALQAEQAFRQIPVHIQFTANIWQEGDWFVAKCHEVEVASQGHTEQEALNNLQEALELYFEPPHPAILP